MSGLFVILAAIIVFAVLDILGTQGVDSRTDFDDLRAPARGLS